MPCSATRGAVAGSVIERLPPCMACRPHPFSTPMTPCLARHQPCSRRRRHKAPCDTKRLAGSLGDNRLTIDTTSRSIRRTQFEQGERWLIASPSAAPPLDLSTRERTTCGVTRPVPPPTQAGPGGSGLGILVAQQPPIHAQQRPRDPAAREGKVRREAARALDIAVRQVEWNLEGGFGLPVACFFELADDNSIVHRPATMLGEWLWPWRLVSLRVGWCPLVAGGSPPVCRLRGPVAGGPMCACRMARITLSGHLGCGAEASLARPRTVGSGQLRRRISSCTDSTSVVKFSSRTTRVASARATPLLKAAPPK